MFDNKEETFMQTVYILGEVTYVPHYRNPHVFVGPGFPLWKRGMHGIVTDKTP